MRASRLRLDMLITPCVAPGASISPGLRSTANLFALTANLTASFRPTPPPRERAGTSSTTSRQEDEASKTQPASTTDTDRQQQPQPSKNEDPIGRRGTLSGFAGTAHRLWNSLALWAPQPGPCTRPRTGRCRGQPADTAPLAGRVKGAARSFGPALRAALDPAVAVAGRALHVAPGWAAVRRPAAAPVIPPEYLRFDSACRTGAQPRT